MFELLWAILTAPFRFIRWSLTNGVQGYITGAVVFVVVLIGFFAIKSEIRISNQAKATATPAITAPAPNARAAPFKIITRSRIYYAAKALTAEDGTVTMTNYWEYLGGKWSFTKGILVLDKSFLPIKVERR